LSLPSRPSASLRAPEDPSPPHSGAHLCRNRATAL
jgi:hypothetical protein